MKTTAPSPMIAVFYMAICFATATNVQAQVYEWPFNYPINARPEYGIAHDMNQDGSPDFVAWDPAEDNIAIWLNDGYGIFSKTYIPIPPELGGPNYFRRLYAIADFNHDGFPDLFTGQGIATQPQQALIFQNDGEGNFSISENPLPASLNSFEQIHTADFNNDGFTDIITATSNDSIRLYTGTADGSFNLANSIAESTEYLRWTFGDLNGDDLMDFVVSSFVPNPGFGWVPTVQTFTNNGDAGFTKANLNNELTSGGVVDGNVALADMNGDGSPDIIVSGVTTLNMTQNQLDSTMFTHILLNDGNGTFTEYLDHGLPRMFRGYIACADVDDDGDVDVFITGRRNATLIGILPRNGKYESNLMLNDGAGNFTEAVPSNNFLRFGYFDFFPPQGSIYFDDFTGNGKLDLFVSALHKPFPASNWYWELKIYSNGLDCNSLTPGVLTSNLVDNTFCPESLGGSLILNVSDNTGLGKFGIVRTSNGRIVRANDSGVINIDSLPPGNYTAAHLSYLLPGQVQDVEFVNQLKGCRAFSNLIPFAIAPCESGIIDSQPNPTTGMSSVTFTLPATGQATLEVYDLNGRLVRSIYNAMAEKDVEYRFEVDGSHLPNGVYLYRLTTEREAIVDKFMIAR